MPFKGNETLSDSASQGEKKQQHTQTELDGLLLRKCLQASFCGGKKASELEPTTQTIFWAVLIELKAKVNKSESVLVKSILCAGPC